MWRLSAQMPRQWKHVQREPAGCCNRKCPRGQRVQLTIQPSSMAARSAADTRMDRARGLS
eukprot:5658929-Lingulodinium_polyedra.AAC.1